MEEKCTYETFEYIPADNDDNDGTFIFDHQVQYVTQVEDVNNTKYRAAVYDVNSQQYLVDVENTTELVSVSDQFVLSDENNLYENNYLLQQVSNENSNQMEEVIAVEQLNETSMPMEVEVESLANQTESCTEVTVSDEQYKMLEEKGWILLEINDKVFILDTLGLHDITTNDKLIEKLKNEMQNYAALEINSGSTKIENITKHSELSENEENIHYVMENGIGSVENETPEKQLAFVVAAKEEDKPLELIKCENIERPVLASPQMNMAVNEDSQNTNQKRILRIKTKLTFKDIPDKIVLGKTKNGKRLVAKVVKYEDDSIATNESLLIKDEIPNEIVIKNEMIDANDVRLPDSEFINLVNKSIQGMSVCKDQDVAMVQHIIKQILQVLSFKPSALGPNLIITKANYKMVEDHLRMDLKQNELTLVTGKLASVQDGNWCFIYLPDMLKIFASTYEALSAGGTVNQKGCGYYENDFLHIHVAETSRCGVTPQVTIILKKRSLPMELITTKKPQTVSYGCPICAAEFLTKQEIKAHQMEQGHIDIKAKESNENGEEVSKPVIRSIFKCKMCPGIYSNSARLAKHIVTNHIKTKEPNKLA